ncbi:MBL fold metallo-hydrolase [Roseibium algae]|uniref:MBL fold metallo-hydrolase n=1 Tax=Roseibium algae TaxID=3123038 RepID=A0ABU8TMD5_9HYPH
MFTRRSLLTTLAATAATPLLTQIALSSDATVKWSGTRSGENGFFRAPTLLTGDAEAILIDGGFNFPDGDALVKAIQATGKRLTTIYISQSDPDFYFGLTPVIAAFPEARVIAATATVEAIKASAQKKIDVWGPRLGEFGPQKLEQIVFPEAYDAPTLELEGTTIEIVTASAVPNRRYLWVPSLNAVLGGVLVFDGLHVWTADTATPELRAGWISELDTMIARNPSLVIAGHAAEGMNNGLASIEFTRDYLVAFEEEVAKSADSAELIAAMQSRFPGLGLEVALQVGAKVAKGEMKWG